VTLSTTLSATLALASLFGLSAAAHTVRRGAQKGAGKEGTVAGHGHARTPGQ
jgi:hypothetical protein